MPSDARRFELRAFLDASVLEVFAGGREAFTSVVPFVSDRDGPIEIVPFVSGGTGRVRADYWRLASIGIEDTERVGGIPAPTHHASECDVYCCGFRPSSTTQKRPRKSPGSKPTARSSG